MEDKVYNQLKKDIDNILSKNSSKLDLPKIIESVRVTRLGKGETNGNYLIEINDNIHFVVRVCLNPTRVHYLKIEYQVLRNLPEDVGPKAYLLDLTSSVFPYVYIIESFVPGKKLVKWHIHHLKSLARTFASYHKIKSSYYGKFYMKGTRKTHIDLYTYLIEISQYFFKQQAVLKEDPLLRKLMPLVKAYLTKKQHLADQLKSFSLIHGDTSIQNLLYENHRVHIIDWELAGFGDNASDFATFFHDDYPYYIWRIALVGKRRDIFIREYQKYFPDSTLNERIDVWITIQKIGGLIFCKWKLLEYEQHKQIGLGTLSKTQLQKEINKLSNSLRKQLKNYA